MIAAASLLLGWRPAVLTAIVSYVGGQYLFMDPRLLTTVFQDVSAVLVYGVSAALVILLGHLARRARAQLAEAVAEGAEQSPRTRVMLANAAYPHTLVGERGYRFSGGEKQRLAIARLQLKAPDIVGWAEGAESSFVVPVELETQYSHMPARDALSRRNGSATRSSPTCEGSRGR
jgi:hypothetical protein